MTKSLCGQSSVGGLTYENLILHSTNKIFTLWKFMQTCIQYVCVHVCKLPCSQISCILPTIICLAGWPIIHQNPCNSTFWMFCWMYNVKRINFWGFLDEVCWWLEKYCVPCTGWKKSPNKRRLDDSDAVGSQTYHVQRLGQVESCKMIHLLCSHRPWHKLPGVQISALMCGVLHWCWTNSHIPQYIHLCL